MPIKNLEERRRYQNKYNKQYSEKFPYISRKKKHDPSETTIDSILLAFNNSGEGLGLKMKEEK